MGLVRIVPAPGLTPGLFKGLYAGVEKPADLGENTQFPVFHAFCKSLMELGLVEF